MKRQHAAMLSAILLAAQLIQPALAGTQTTTTIRINPRQQRGTVSPLIYGTNHRFFANGVGMWDPANKRVFPGFDKTYDEIGLRSLRYPAGTAGHFFEWKKAIGPVEQRGLMHRISGQQVFSKGERVTFGIDEAARWSEAHGNALVYMYGIANSNAREAADLIEYLNAPTGTNPNGGTAWAEVRAKNGREKPYNIRYFEIANEMDGPSQKFWLPHITTAQKDEAAKLASKNLEDKRASYAREYCFGGVAAFTKQPVKLPEDYRDDAAKSDGQPNQIKQVMYFPVEPGSDHVFVDDEAWQRVPDVRVEQGGNVYQINSEAGHIIFGDGKTGAIPPLGKQVTVNYRAKRDGFVDYYREMKKVDPSIKVYAGYESKRIIHELGATHPYDGIVVHSYAAPWNFPKRTFAPNDFSHRLMLGAEERAAELVEYQTEMRRTVGGKRAEDMHVVVTEYGALRLTDTQAEPKSNYVRSLEQGLYVGQLLLGFMRMGMPFAHKHSTISDADGVIGPAPDFIPTATARVFQTFTHMFGDRLVAVETEGNPTRATADDHKLAKLDMEASTDKEGNVYLIVINRDAVDAVPSTIDVAGRSIQGEAGIWTVDAASFSAFNTVENPDAVRLRKESKRASGKPFKHVFPAHSLTAIKFTKSF
ncbi:MAG: hypothetical protein M3R15_14605 [Acidobacteriota bacterium]|nr:hypothetical protein [Acidobacteriota bacterium]